MKLAWSIIWLIIAILVIASFPMGKNVPMSAQGAIYDSLSTAAGIVFGVMGAWSAIVYPDALKAIVDHSNPQKEEAFRRISRLVTPMFISLLIIAASLILKIGTLIAKFSIDLSGYVQILRGLSLSTITLLSCLIIVSLVYAISPGIDITESLRAKLDRGQRIKRMKSNHE